MEIEFRIHVIRYEAARGCHHAITFWRSQMSDHRHLFYSNPKIVHPHPWALKNILFFFSFAPMRSSEPDSFKQ